MNYGVLAQQQYNNQTASEVAHLSQLQELVNQLDYCWQSAVQIGDALDRALGAQPVEKQSAPQAVPNGLLEDIRARLSALSQSLEASASRASRIA